MASLVGTAIEFYDFYIYGTAAALVFGPVFFPQESDAAQLLLSFATFAIAFVARPVGSALLGHFGDRVGRKATLVASLLLMGVSTMLIGVLARLCHDRLAGAGAAVPDALLARASASAANGAGRRCWRWRTPRPASAAGSACSRSSARRSASSPPTACSCCWRWGWTTSSSGGLGLARAVPAQRRAGGGRSLCPAEAGRDAGVPRGDGAAGAGARADRRGADPLYPDHHPRHAGDGVLLRPVLHHHGVLARLRHQGARLFAPDLPRAGMLRHHLPRPRHPALLLAQRPARAAPGADRRRHPDGAVRLRPGAAAGRRLDAAGHPVPAASGCS